MRDSFSIACVSCGENHLTQKALGERCGLSKNIIGQYEKGEKIPSLVTLIELADISMSHSTTSWAEKIFFERPTSGGKLGAEVCYGKNKRGRFV